MKFFKNVFKQDSQNAIIKFYVDKGYNEDWLQGLVKDLTDAEDIKKVLEIEIEKYELKTDKEILEVLNKGIKELKEKGYCKKKYYNGDINVFTFDYIKNNKKISDIRIRHLDKDYSDYWDKWDKIQLKRNRKYILASLFSNQSFYCKENAEKAMDLCIEFLQEIKK